MRTELAEMDLDRDLDSEFVADVAFYLRRCVDQEVLAPTIAFFTLSNLHEGLMLKDGNTIVKFGSLHRRLFLIRLRDRLRRTSGLNTANIDVQYALLVKFLDPVIRQPVLLPASVTPSAPHIVAPVATFAVGTVTTSNHSEPMTILA